MRPPAVDQTGLVPPFDPELRAATERWFVRRGLPHVIEGYSATEDVFTRAAPFLAAVFFLEVFGSFDDRFSGWSQVAVFVAGVAILVCAVALVNRMRGRRLFQLPDDVGVPELALFVLVPALLPVLFSDEPGWRFLAVAVLNLVLLGVTYVITSFALLPMIRFGALQMTRRLGHIGQLVARTLPLLLLFTAFIFLNAEMWQVASDFPALYYGVVVAALGLSGTVFLGLRAPREVADLEHFETWRAVTALASSTDAPLAGVGPGDPSQPPSVRPLGRGDRANVTLLVIMSQAVQVVLVGLVIGMFYVGFGLLAVRAATIDQWTVAGVDALASFDLAGSTIVITWEHLAVAGFIAAFSALQFAVSMATDAAYRDEFYEDVTREIRETLAVRALYLDRLAEAEAEAAADA